ncbi:hypothetical protein HanHA300_Chr09g0315231 [Helianthus annuus]|nr:hypothetical protein HanHA300_Chr09g0315231 [Helianthus annuus]KAJ0542099.1 hypothetical protein HanHA89_Chr09g0336091 [Helianthus annuus]
MSSVPTDTEHRLRYRYMKVKNGCEPVSGTPKVDTELVLKIFRFGKFNTGTQNNLLV